MESSIQYLLNLFKDADVYGVVPQSSEGENIGQGIIEFLSIGFVLPWAWISVILITIFILGLVIYLFVKDLDSWGGLHGIRKNYGLWVLFLFGSLLGYIVIYWLVFTPFASFSILRNLEVDLTHKKIQAVDQNFFQYSIPFSKISHLAYIRKNSHESSGFWIVKDHRTKHAILRWSEDPFQENEFLKWAEGLAKSWDTILIPYHDRDNLFRSEKFQNYLLAQGLMEKKLPIHDDDGILREVEIHWEIPSIKNEMEGVDWVFWFSGVIAILMFTPFYLAALCAVCLLPTLIRSYLLGHEPKEKLQNIILKSKFFYIGIALLIAFFVGMYNSTTYVKQADKIRITLSKHQLYYSIENQNQKILERKRLEGLDFWLDLLLGNPLTIWDRLAEFSQSNNIELEMDFSQANRIHSHEQKIIFSKREAGKKEDNLETFTFDLSGLDPSVFQYINYQIQELSKQFPFPLD